ncbi:MAG: AhpC/TSA family protein [Alphaproteobacteria bacterium]
MVRTGERVPAELASAGVWDEHGRQMELAAFWKERPAVVVFLRHFGCPCGSAQMAELTPRLGELHRLGMRTVLVGNGAPNFIDGFKERFGLFDKAVEVTTDPSLRSFRAAGLLRSWWMSYGPRGLWDALLAIGKGHVGRFGEGDGLQHGGTLIVGTDGIVALYHRNLTKGGHLPAVEIIETAMRLALERSPLRI